MPVADIFEPRARGYKIEFVTFDQSADVLVMTGISNVVSRELWKVSDTITRTEHAPVEFLVFINEKVWQSPSPEHQATMTAAARRAGPAPADGRGPKLAPMASRATST